MSVVHLNSHLSDRFKKFDSKGFYQKKSKTIAVLDIGSSKVCCLIADISVQNNNDINLKGYSYLPSDGIKAGNVIDIDAAEKSICAVVDQAEQMAGVFIDRVYVNISCGKPQCHIYTGTTAIRDAVNDLDMHRAIQNAKAKIKRKGKNIIHISPINYCLDDNSGIRNPSGMFGDYLSVDISVIMVNQGPMRNLSEVIERCHLKIAGFIAAPYASSQAVVTSDEKQIGVTAIDMGCETTNISSFYEGQLVFNDIIPIGSNHITMDIARGLSTSMVHAERLKTLFGTVLPGDDGELVTAPLVGEKGVNTLNRIPKTILTNIIRPRVEETFEMAHSSIMKHQYAKLARRRVVLTGGGSQLTGVRELAEMTLGQQVRLGGPENIKQPPKQLANPAFATASGLLYCASMFGKSRVVLPDLPDINIPTGSYFERVQQWLKDNF